MTDEAQIVSRRQGDVVLEQVKVDLALLKQAVELGAKATEGNLVAIGKSIEFLTNKVDQVLEAQADPAASAGGRAILEKIGEIANDVEKHEVRIEALETFETTASAAYRTLRAQMAIIGFLLGAVSGIAAVLSIMHGPAT